MAEGNPFMNWSIFEPFTNTNRKRNWKHSWKICSLMDKEQEETGRVAKKKEEKKDEQIGS